MDCKEAEELFVPFVLGAIDDRERRLVDSHLESCGACSVALYGETVAGFALELPQLEAPPQVKQRLFKRVERDGWLARMASRFMVKIGTFADGFSQAFMPQVGKAIASVLIIGVVFAGVWFNDRPNDVAQTNDDLANQLEASQLREAKAIQAVNTTIDALANPRMSVNFLKGTGAWTSARGVMVSQTETRALLLVVDLPPSLAC